MHILITGATSVIGRTAAARLLAAGHRVSGIAQQSHPYLDDRVDLTCAPLGSPALRDLAAAADVVLHLAPVVADVPESAGIEGVLHVSDAAARAGSRLLFVSPTVGEPALTRYAEELVKSSWAPSLIIRIAPPVGRQVDWMVSRTVSTLLTGDTGRAVRVLHTDDLHRFLVRSVGSHRTGVVDLGTADTLPLLSARRWLGAVHRHPRRLPVWPSADVEFDITALHRDWDFACGWTISEALADTGRALRGHRLGVAGTSDRTGRSPLIAESIPRASCAHETGVHPAAAADCRGEFDDGIDPRRPRYSARCTSDALPGPLTPMTLDVQCAGLRAAHHATAELIGLRGPLAQEWRRRATAVFAHRVFVGTSISAAVEETLAKAIPAAALAPRVVNISRRYAGWCNDFADSAAAGLPTAAGWATLTDAQLDVRMPLLRDRIHQGWELTTVGVLVERLLLRTIQHNDPVLPLLAATTATSQLAAETALVADLLRGDERLRELASAGDLAGLRASFPAAAAAIDAAIARVGYRGPGEAELANPVLAESPGQLLAAAALAAQQPPAPVEPERRGTLPQRLADGVHAAHELAWDTTAHATHHLRLALREKGSRLAAQRIVAAPEDVFYLTLDEALTPPVDTRLRVHRRRAERERLQALNMPDVIDGRWAPLVDAAAPDLVPAIPTTEMEPQGQA